VDPFLHTFISVCLLAVFFYSGYVYAWYKLRQNIIAQVAEAMTNVRIVMEDDDEDTERKD